MDEDVALKTCRTRDLGERDREAFITLCIAAHRVNFGLLFNYLAAEGLHVLACAAGRPCRSDHALAATGELPLLRTAYVDAVATAPEYQGRGIGSTLMRHLAAAIADYEPACLETG